MILVFELVQVPVAPPLLTPAMRKRGALKVRWLKQGRGVDA